MHGRALSETFEFVVAGSRLVGRLYLPRGPARAAIVTTGPLTSVKEQASGAYAEALAARGFAAIAFDHRYFGESDGEPRQFENPVAKIRDIRAAVPVLREGPATRGLPVMAVGVCVGAGYMARAVAEDGRIDAFAGVAGYYAEATQEELEKAKYRIARGLAAERTWLETGVAETIPAVAEGGGDVAMPLKEAFEFYGTSRGAVPSYVNGFAVQSFTAPFDAVGTAPKIFVPTLVVHSENALSPSLARKFATGLRRGEQVWLRSKGQIDFYDDPRLIGEAADKITEFFGRVLEERT
jgi:fermentation-respiration switch protein FrsA (DUF1100 family)